MLDQVHARCPKVSSVPPRTVQSTPTMLNHFFDLTKYNTENTVSLKFHRKRDKCRLLSTVIIVDCYQLLYIRVRVTFSLTDIECVTCIAQKKTLYYLSITKKRCFGTLMGLKVMPSISEGYLL